MSEQLAWAAGFFDGEGCVRYSTRQSKLGRQQIKRAIVVSITQNSDGNNQESLNRFCAAVGVGKVCGPYSRSKGHTYQYEVWNVDDVRTIFKLLEPWLGTIKKTAFRDAINSWENHYNVYPKL